MSTNENSDPTATRVTRSLRKRLTSIDSDVSIRATTPTLVSLQSINETITPSKRTTRRTSLSTPIATPSKAKGRTENIDSPARRTTRRRSVSIIEHAEHLAPMKSVEPTIAVVKEEETVDKSPEQNRRVTRSSSKSPQEIKSKMTAAKKKSSPEKQGVVINLDDSAESVSSNKKQTKILMKKEKDIDKMLIRATPSPKKPKDKQNESTPEKADAAQIDRKSDSSKKIEVVTAFTSSPAKTQSEQESSKKSEKKEEQVPTSTKLDISQKGGQKSRVSIELFSPSKKGASLINAKQEDSPHKKATGKKSRVSIELFSPSKKNASTNAIQDESPQKKKTRPEKLKNVAFNETAEEETMKNVFPKTPGLTKSKSYILDSSKDVEKELSTTKFSDNHNESITESEKKTDKDEEEEVEYTDVEEEHEEVPTTKTPYKLKLKVVQSSTPVQIASPKKNKAIEAEENRKEESLKEKKQSDTEGAIGFPKSWTQSVSGKVSEKAKLDSIESEDTLRKKLEEEEALKKAEAAALNKSKETSGRQAIDDSEDEDDLLEQDDDEDDVHDEDEDDEEENREKTIFIDDEAMEVPEGEESMDSEERQYLEENEVPAYGESIGSEDSEDGEFEEEADEEDDAFIVSDSEDVNCPIESDSEEEIEKKPKGKKYKRIIRRSESSLDEEYISSKLKDTNVTLDSKVIEEDDDPDNIDEAASKEVAVEPEAQVVNKSQRKSTSNAEKSEKTTEKERKSLSSSRRDVISLEEVSDVEMEDLEQVLQSTQSLNKSKLNESVKVDASNRKSTNNTENNIQENTSKEGIPNKRNSLKKTVEADNNDVGTKDKSQSIVERKSLNSSKLRKSSDDDISEQEMETQEVTTKSLNKSKHEVPEGEDDLGVDNSAAIRENKPRKSLNKSKLEAQQSEDDSEMNHSATTKPTKSSRKSLNKSKLEASQMGDVLEENLQQSVDDSEANLPATTKPTKASRKSLNKSKLEASQIEDVLEENLQKSEDDSETNHPSTTKPTKASRKSLNKSKLEASQMADVLGENPQQSEDDSETNHSATTKPTKASRKSLNKSKLEASQMTDVLEENPQQSEDDSETNHSATTKPTIASRKSLNKSKLEASQMADDLEEEISKLSKRASLSKEQTKGETPSKGGRRKSIIPVSELQNDEHTEIEPNKSNECHDSDSDHEEDNIELPKEELNKSMQKSRKSTNMDDEEKPPKQNLNTSRKSIARSSIEGANDEEEQHSLQSRSMNKSKLEKTVLSFEDNSEPEETLSSSEVPSRTSGSFNSSRRKSLSLNQSKLSVSDDESDTQAETSEHKKPLRKTSVDKDLVLRVDTDEEEVSDNDQPDQAEEHEDHFSDRNPAEKSTIMEFLGEEDDDEAEDRPVDLNASRRRSSANKSKLDETFELDIAHSVSRHESLHRSIMRKSLNHSAALKGEMEQEDSESENNSDSDDSSAEDADGVHKKKQPGLSVSLSNIEIKKKKLKGDGKLIHNSFTIGVSVKRSGKSPSPSLSCPASESECEQVLSEQEDLEKIKNIHRVGPFKSRNSLSSSLRMAPSDLDESKKQKRIKRTSLYLQENAASQSFVENITEEKKKVGSKRKRLSNSFCGVIAPSMEEDVPTPHEEETNQKSLELTDDKPLESGDKTNLQRILSRCDEILEAANMAKREAKLNSKKTKVKKPKWMDNAEKKESQEENEVKIPLVSRKELKRKEKIKKELAKAIKHSTAMLETIDPKLAKALKTVREAESEPAQANKSSKRLPIDFLNTLVESSSSSKKKNKLKEIESTPPSDKENSKKSSNKDTQSISTNDSQARKKNKSATSSSTTDTQIEKKKKKHQREVLETATGTVIVEPSTPVKQRIQNGFRESPKTPAGFRVQDIYSAGQNERDKSHKKGKKLFTSSGEFIEEDLSLSTSKTNPKKEKTHKRKRHIEEPIYSLPKTQWTPSGVFVEEDLYSSRPLANSTATQFTVTSLNGSKKMKNATKAVSATSLNSALSFKQNAVSNANIRRETGRQLIHRKQRQVSNKQF